MDELPDNAMLLINGAYGIYIPQMFAFMFKAQLSEQDAKDLESPDNEYYWDAWDDVLNKTFIIEGVVCTLEQDGDLWAIPVNN